MAITSKPSQKPQQPESAPLDEDTVKQLIHKGGTPPVKEEAKGGSHLKNVQLRLPEDVLGSIDAAIEKRNALTRPSRHTWLLEAIAEKLVRETNPLNNG